MRGARGIMALLVLVLVMPLVLSVGHGEECEPSVLNTCGADEMCAVAESGSRGTCQCLPHLHYDPATHTCRGDVPPAPKPESSGVALGVGLGLTLTILAAAIIVVVAHRRYGILAPVLRRLPVLYPFGRRNNEEFVVDDDDSPIF